MNKEEIDKRLIELGENAKFNSRVLVSEYENNFKGIVEFSLMIAQTVRTLCNITPGFHEETFIEDVKAVARLWVEAGEPTE